MASAAPGVVWVLGKDETGDQEALEFNGEQWTLSSVPQSGASLVVLGNDDVWMADSGACVKSGGGTFTCTTTVQHWDGTSWHSSTVPVGAAVLAGMGHHVWLAGSRVTKEGNNFPQGREAIFQRTSGKWDRVAAPDREIVGYPSLGVSPAGEVWLLAKNAGAATIHLDQRIGQRWSKFKVNDDLLGPAHNPFQLSYDGHHGFWFGSDHWTGRRLIRTLVPGSESKVDFVSVTAPVPGTSSVWGIAQTRSGEPLSLIAIYGKLP
jgi:hypothetical protein